MNQILSLKYHNFSIVFIKLFSQSSQQVHFIFIFSEKLKINLNFFRNSFRKFYWKDENWSLYFVYCFMGNFCLFSKHSYGMGGEWMVEFFRRIGFCWWFCCAHVKWNFRICRQSICETSAEYQGGSTQHSFHTCGNNIVVDWFAQIFFSKSSFLEKKGWIGFNGGSVYRAHALAMVVVLNTCIAGTFGWFIYYTLEASIGTGVRYAFHRGFLSISSLNGMIVGFVAITPAAGFVPIWASFVISFVATVAVFFWVQFLNRRNYVIFKNDSMGNLHCHFLPGSKWISSIFILIKKFASCNWIVHGWSFCFTESGSSTRS